MGKKSRKKNRRGGRALEPGGPSPATETITATAPPAPTPLGTERVVRKKVRKVSAKEQAALAKQAARDRWAERMTAEGR